MIKKSGCIVGAFLSILMVFFLFYVFDGLNDLCHKYFPHPNAEGTRWESPQCLNDQTEGTREGIADFNTVVGKQPFWNQFGLVAVVVILVAMTIIYFAAPPKAFVDK